MYRILETFAVKPDAKGRITLPSALRKALAALPGDLTVFIVSQRAASLQHADQILVLDDGHLVGIGTHDQLRQTCPVYEEIYESQFKKGDAQK